MATNITFNPGNHQSLPVPAGTKSGDPVRVGGLNGIAVTDRANTSVSPFNSNGTPNAAYNAGGGNKDGYASVWLEGAPTFDVKGASIAPGAPIYYDPAGTPKLTATAGSLTLYGHALTAGVTSTIAGAESVVVRIAN